MSKTYQALMEAERLRATQDPAALARGLARAAEEGQTLRAELHACQEQLAALVKRVDAAPSIDPAAIEDLGRQVARLVTVQGRLKEELDRRSATVQSQSQEVAGIARRLDEIHAAVVPAIQTIHREIDELQAGQRRDIDAVRAQVAPLVEAHRRQHGLADGVERAQASADEAGRRVAAVEEAQAANAAVLRQEMEALRAESARVLAAVGAVQSSLTAPLQLGGEVEALRAQVAPLVEAHRRQHELAEGVERAQTNADEAARRVAAVEEAQASNAAGVRQEMEALRAESARVLAAVGAVQSSLAAPLQLGGEVEALRAQVAPLVEAHRRQHELAEGVERAQASADQAARRAAAIDEAHASSLALLQQQVAELQMDRGILHDALGALRSSLDQQLESAAEIEALRAKMAQVVEAQARQRELANEVRRVQTTADEAVRRMATFDETQGTELAAVRQEVAALQADRDRLREVLGVLQASVARQLESAGEVAVLRKQLAPLAEAQVRLQELAGQVGRAQATADETLRRLAAIDKGQASGRATLEEQIAELRTDRAKLDGVLESRFELLCSIIDAEMDAKVEQLEARIGELRMSAPEPVESEDPPPKTATDALVRHMSSIALTRKKAR